MDNEFHDFHNACTKAALHAARASLDRQNRSGLALTRPGRLATARMSTPDQSRPGGRTIIRQEE